MESEKNEGYPDQLRHPECLPTHVIQVEQGVNSTQFDLIPRATGPLCTHYTAHLLN